MNYFSQIVVDVDYIVIISARKEKNVANVFKASICFVTFVWQVFEENPELDAQRIWNCDESGFPTDPSKGKVICEKVFRNTLRIFFASIIHITTKNDYIVTSELRANHL